MASWPGRPAGEESDPEDELMMGFGDNREYEEEVLPEFSHDAPVNQGFPTTETVPEPTFDCVKMTSDLRIAILKGNLQITKEIMETGYPVEGDPRAGWNPLLHACTCSQLHIVSYLLDKGASVLFDSNLYNPLMALCASSSTDKKELMACCEKMIRCGADVNNHERQYMTPIMFAIRSGHEEIVEYLLCQGANVNARDSRGWPPLAWAASLGNGKIIKLLLEHNADPNINTSNKDSIADVARNHGFHKTAEFMEKVVNDRTSAEVDARPEVHTPPMQEQRHLDDKPTKQWKVKKSGDLELFLRGIGLPHLVSAFEMHQIDFRTFLTLSEDELVKVGVDKLGERKIIVDSLKQTHMRKWQESSLPYLRDRDAINSPELHAVLENISKHLAYMQSTVVFLKKKVHEKPAALEIGKDIVSVASTHCQAKNSLDNLQALQKELKLLALFLDKETRKVQHKSADLVTYQSLQETHFIKKSVLLAGVVVLGVVCWKTLSH